MLEELSCELEALSLDELDVLEELSCELESLSLDELDVLEEITTVEFDSVFD